MVENQNGAFEASNGVWFLTDSDTIVTFGNNSNMPISAISAPVATITTENNSTLKYMKWGANNDEPDVREALIENNNILPSLLESKVYMLLGSRMILYKWVAVEDKATGGVKMVQQEIPFTRKVKQWIKDFKIHDLRHDAARDLIFHSQFFIEFTKKLKGELANAEIFRAKQVRPAEIDNAGEVGRMRINNWLVCGDWKHARKHGVLSVRSYQGLKKESKAKKYLRRYANRLLGGPYFYAPTWWGSRLWVQLANCIPEFHLRNLENGYTIRYHVKFPKDYFYSNDVKHGTPTDAEKEKAHVDAETRKKAFMQKLNNHLAGIKNTGRAFFSTYDVQKAVGKEFPGVIIEPISADLKDEALLKLFDKSNEAIVSGLGILPSVSGVNTPGKLSSGSDIRNAFAFYLISKTPEQRRILNSAINDIAEMCGIFNEPGLEDAEFGSSDMIITTTDKNPSGKEPLTDKSKNEATV